MRRTDLVEEAIDLFAICLLSRQIPDRYGHMNATRQHGRWALQKRGYCIWYEDGLPALRRISKAQADCTPPAPSGS